MPIYVNTTPVAGFTISPADTVCTNTTVTFTNTTVGDEIVGGVCDPTPAILWRISPPTGWTVTSGPLGNGFGFDDYPNSWAPSAWVSGTQALGVTFTTPGTYDITMLAGVSCAPDSITHSICVEAPPVPSFTLSPLWAALRWWPTQ
ncbi:MAG: hypothetical protein IPP26_01530 [Flavobacteriales bacterium]|nr:hypothetical protein [Flavobacteriales bacterium]